MISESEKKNLLVGFKQTLRAVEEKRAEKVFLAGDCESKISAPIENAASSNGTQIFYVSTMKELGELKLCGHIKTGVSQKLLRKEVTRYAYI